MIPPEGYRWHVRSSQSLAAGEFSSYSAVIRLGSVFLATHSFIRHLTRRAGLYWNLNHGGEGSPTRR